MGDDLKMQVRRPAAVDLVAANAGKGRSLRNGLAMVEASERALAQVTVQRVEGEALAGRERDGVLQDYGGTIVKRRVVVAKTVHYTVERSQDRRANLHEYIEANVHRAPLGSVITCNPLLATRGDRARFVVPANAYTAARRPHAIKEQVRELRDI